MTANGVRSTLTPRSLSSALRASASVRWSMGLPASRTDRRGFFSPSRLCHRQRDGSALERQDAVVGGCVPAVDGVVNATTQRPGREVEPKRAARLDLEIMVFQHLARSDRPGPGARRRSPRSCSFTVGLCRVVRDASRARMTGATRLVRGHLTLGPGRLPRVRCDVGRRDAVAAALPRSPAGGDQRARDSASLAPRAR